MSDLSLNIATLAQGALSLQLCNICELSLKNAISHCKLGPRLEQDQVVDMRWQGLAASILLVLC